MALAALTAYQAVFLTPILAVYAWLFDRQNRTRLGGAGGAGGHDRGWQVFSALTTGALPASELTGYFASYGFQALAAQAAPAR